MNRETEKKEKKGKRMKEGQGLYRRKVAELMEQREERQEKTGHRSVCL